MMILQVAADHITTPESSFQLSLGQIIVVISFIIANAVTMTITLVTIFVNHKRDIKDNKNHIASLEVDLTVTDRQVEKNKDEIVDINRRLEEGKGKFKRLDEIVLERENQIRNISSGCSVHTAKIQNIELENAKLQENSKSFKEELTGLKELMNTMSKDIKTILMSMNNSPNYKTNNTK